MRGYDRLEFGLKSDRQNLWHDVIVWPLSRSRARHSVALTAACADSRTIEKRAAMHQTKDGSKSDGIVSSVIDTFIGSSGVEVINPCIRKPLKKFMPVERRPEARILLADDHRLFADACKRLLEPEFVIVAIVEDGRDLMGAVSRQLGQTREFTSCLHPFFQIEVFWRSQEAQIGPNGSERLHAVPPQTGRHELSRGLYVMMRFILKYVAHPGDDLVIPRIRVFKTIKGAVGEQMESELQRGAQPAILNSR